MTVVHFVSHHFYVIFLTHFMELVFMGKKLLQLIANHHVLFVRFWSKKSPIQDAK